MSLFTLTYPPAFHTSKGQQLATVHLHRVLSPAQLQHLDRLAPSSDLSYLAILFTQGLLKILHLSSYFTDFPHDIKKQQKTHISGHERFRFINAKNEDSTKQEEWHWLHECEHCFEEDVDFLPDLVVLKKSGQRKNGTKFYHMFFCYILIVVTEEGINLI